MLTNIVFWKAPEQGTPQMGQIPRAGGHTDHFSKDLDRWAYWNHVELDFSRPGKASDNALVEAFNSRFRQECLNQHWFMSLEDAKTKLSAWQMEHNTNRPHSSLG